VSFPWCVWSVRALGSGNLVGEQMTILDRTDVGFVAEVDRTAPVRLVSDVGRRLLHDRPGAAVAAMSISVPTVRWSPAPGR
jgi:DNA-binding IclR family transcriptional regulator